MSEATRTGGRYAIYFSHEPESPWGQAGARWIGRMVCDPTVGAPWIAAGQDPADFRRWTAAPRRYGWHATLKAPFALAAGADEAALMQAVDRLTKSLRAFDMPALSVEWLDDFLALVDCSNAPALNDVADACVTRLHPFEAAPGLESLLRRRASGLSEREDELLLRWGYPYVLDCFRFHMSLTGPMADASQAQREAVHQAAAAWFSTLPPARFDALTVFWESVPGADFQCLQRMRFGQ
jgi:hypothetical protein